MYRCKHGSSSPPHPAEWSEVLSGLFEQSPPSVSPRRSVSDLAHQRLCRILLEHVTWIIIIIVLSRDTGTVLLHLCHNSLLICTSSMFTHPSLTLWQLQDPGVYVGSHGGPLQLLPARRNATVKDVVANGVIEKNRILRNNADVGPQRRLADLEKTKRQKYKHVVRRQHLNSIVPVGQNTHYKSGWFSLTLLSWTALTSTQTYSICSLCTHVCHTYMYTAYICYINVAWLNSSCTI